MALPWYRALKPAVAIPKLCSLFTKCRFDHVPFQASGHEIGAIAVQINVDIILAFPAVPMNTGTGNLTAANETDIGAIEAEVHKVLGKVTEALVFYSFACARSEFKLSHVT